MGLFGKMFGHKDSPVASPQHAVLVHLRLSNAEFGDSGERDACHALSDELEKAIAAANAGELDGDEFGGGECVLFMYGPDADRIFSAIEPVLRASRLARGGHAVKRYGAPGKAKEIRIAL